MRLRICLQPYCSARWMHVSGTPSCDLKSRELEGLLVGKALSTTLINPHWGRWSLTNEELVNDIAFYEAVDAFGSVVGVTLSEK